MRSTMLTAGRANGFNTSSTFDSTKLHESSQAAAAAAVVSIDTDTDTIRPMSAHAHTQQCCKIKWSYDPRGYERNFSNCVEKFSRFSSTQLLKLR